MRRPITFLRLRPADSVNELTAATRRREGTTALEVTEPTTTDVATGHAGGLLVIARDASTRADAWALTPEAATPFLGSPPAGWRLTIIDEGPSERVLDALARTRALFLRTGRSGIP